ncbi:MAG TPA: helix-turn-helix transcriptional regulator [Bacteroidales bacterium]|nr:helix-turn-helix transcriptional regulator [Bacteroidales bacterium]
MLYYIVSLIFIISAALATGGIILSTRLRNKFHNEVFSSLLYFQIFIYTFGFYGIWGQVVIRAYLSSLISPEILSRITEISSLIGLPFLVFAWLMLIRLSCGLSGRNCSMAMTIAFLLSNFVLLAIIGYSIAQEGGIRPAMLLKIYLIILNCLSSIIASLLIILHRRKIPLKNSDKSRIIAASLILVMLSQCIPLYLYEGQILTGLVFTLFFFTGNAFLPVYLTYGNVLSEKSQDDTMKNISFDEFCSRYDISPREKDIIREICNGLSNQEISDKLFISLQTVKDHTHRIYIKTNVRSRVQLINLVKTEEGQN